MRRLLLRNQVCMAVLSVLCRTSYINPMKWAGHRRTGGPWAMMGSGRVTDEYDDSGSAAGGKDKHKTRIAVAVTIPEHLTTPSCRENLKRSTKGLRYQ